MYQGVFTQCYGVAHNSRFSDFFSISKIISFHFSVVCTYGAPFHPNSHAIWGIYHPIYFFNYLLLCMGQLPSRTFSMRHLLFPFLAAFIAHYISHYYGVYKFTWGTFPSRFIMGYLAFPFNNCPDSWGTCPSHSHLQL